MKISFFVLFSLWTWAYSAQVQDQFVEQVVPVIENHCIRCHKPDNAKGKLSLATKEDWLTGGRDGAAAIPFQANKSLVIDLIQPHGRGEIPEMPEEGEPLTEEQIHAVIEWINAGMVWPEGVVIEERSKADKSFWSLQPIANVPIPEVEVPDSWSDNPIDLFVYQKLKEQGLSHSRQASKRELIRRATFDLHGLPPTPERVKIFLKDDSEDAYAKLIDELLASKRYGERWGRHWLDVVRFAESSGFERNRIRDNAWPFRDYVIDSFNEDKSFDQFIVEHLAGDQILPLEPRREIGTAFLVAGAYDDVGNQDPVAKKQIRANTLDDMIAATGSAFLGMSISCSRCHDHKFDPIEQADYYRMRAAFEGVRQGGRVITSAEQKRTDKEQRLPLQKKIKTIEGEIAEFMKAIRKRVDDQKNKLIEQHYPRPAVDAVLTEESFEPVKAKYVRLKVIAPSSVNLEEFEIWTHGENSRNVALKSEGGHVEVSTMRYSNDDPLAYGAHHLNDGFYGSFWISSGKDSTATFRLAKEEIIDRVVFSNNRTKTRNRRMPDTYVIEVSTDGHTWIQVASEKGRKPANVQQLHDLLAHKVMSSQEKQQHQSLRSQLNQYQNKLKQVKPLPVYWAGRFTKKPELTYLYQGGDVTKEKGTIVPAGLNFLDHVQKPFRLKSDQHDGERRLALAKWMVDEKNPLTSRVLVNRVWQHHFGRGIVATPSDFGYMGARPTHPELLDWLALQLKKGDWKLKSLHKLIMLSQTYQQSSHFDEQKSKVDANSEYLWRYPPRRLEAEAIRDTMLYTTGLLDMKMHGPGFRLYEYTIDNVATYYPLDKIGSDTYRRAVYHQTPRSVRVDLMTEYDMPDCSLSKPKRDVTVSPLQALTLQNHSFAMDLAHGFVKRLKHEVGENEGLQIKRAYQLLLSRDPNPKEMSLSQKLVETHGLLVFCRALLNSNEVIYVD